METMFEIKGDVLVAGLSGERDHHIAEKIRNDIDETMGIYSARNLILDFENVTFMDSSGVGMVLGRYKKINERDGRVLVCGCDEYVKRILYMSGVFSLVEYKRNRAEAIYSFESK